MNKDANGMPANGDRILDLRGLKCPLPALRTKKALVGMSPGERLVVEATDPMSAIDIPHLIGATGDTLFAVERTGELIRFTLRKAG
jgi:tRNA 2-thiouridine synthesizing protein A